MSILAPAILGAQIPNVAAGSRVRVTTTFGRLTGSYVDVVGDSLAVDETAGGRRRFYVDHVKLVEVSLGTSRRASVTKGLLIGLGVGAAAGAIYLASTQLTTPYAPNSSIPLGPTQARNRAVSQVFLGGAVGGLIGSTRRLERWRRVFP